MAYCCLWRGQGNSPTACLGAARFDSQIRFLQFRHSAFRGLAICSPPKLGEELITQNPQMKYLSECSSTRVAAGSIAYLGFSIHSMVLYLVFGPICLVSADSACPHAWPCSPEQVLLPVLAMHSSAAGQELFRRVEWMDSPPPLPPPEGVSKLSSDGKSVALVTDSSGGGGGVALMMSISSCCPAITATSLGPNWGISAAINALWVILITSWSLSHSLCSRSQALSSLAAISAPVSPLTLALPWARSLAPKFMAVLRSPSFPPYFIPLFLYQYPLKFREQWIPNRETGGAYVESLIRLILLLLRPHERAKQYSIHRAGCAFLLMHVTQQANYPVRSCLRYII